MLACHSDRDDGTVGELLAYASGVSPRRAKRIWDAVNPHTGRRRIDEAFPQAMRDNPRARHAHPLPSTAAHGKSSAVTASSPAAASDQSTAGIVFTEYALANPSALGLLQAHTGRKQRLGGLDLYSPRTQSSTSAVSARQPDTRLVRRDPHRRRYGCSLTRSSCRSPERVSIAVRRRRRPGDVRAGDDVQLHRGVARHVLRPRDGRGAQRGPHPRRRGAAAISTCTRAWDLGVGDDTSIWWFQAQGAPAGAARPLRRERRRPRALPRHHRAAREPSMAGSTAATTFRTTPRSRSGDQGRTRVETMQRWASTRSSFRWRRSTMASTPSDERCRCACFIRAAKRVASARLSNTGASGTTTRSASTPRRCTTGHRTQPTLFDT